jgi:hypothetical protein
LPGPGELHEETSWGLLQITAVRLSDIDEGELLARCCAFSVAECRSRFKIGGTSGGISTLPTVRSHAKPTVQQGFWPIQLSL